MSWGFNWKEARGEDVDIGDEPPESTGERPGMEREAQTEQNLTKLG